jgi:hypothetical protein
VLTEAVPHARRVAAIFNPTRPGLRAYAQEGTVAERALGVTFLPMEVRQPSDIKTAFLHLLHDRPDVPYVVGDPGVIMYRQVADARLSAVVPAVSLLPCPHRVDHGRRLGQRSLRKAVVASGILSIHVEAKNVTP